MKTKNLLQTLQYSAGLFEVVWDCDPDIFDSDHLEEYEDTIQQIREITGVFDRNTYLEAIKDSREELPFERNPDEQRDEKQDR